MAAPAAAPAPAADDGAAAADAPHVPTSLADYARCLRDSPPFRALWVSDVVDTLGSWLNYVAVLELASAFSAGSGREGMALTGVVLIRFLPSLLLAPLAGVLGDTRNRVGVLVACACACAACAAGLALVHRPDQAPLLYALLLAQFSFIALQEPARRAIVPVLVAPADLHLATTLETFSWSITGAVGAAAGGFIAAKVGNSACFILDAASYLAAAYLANKVPRRQGRPDAAERRAAGAAKAAAAGGVGALELGALRGRSGGGNSSDEEDAEGAPLLPPPSSPSARPPSAAAAASAAPARWAPAAAAACAAAGRSLAEGWAFLTARANRDLAALVFLKASGSLTWGAVDVINVKFTEELGGGAPGEQHPAQLGLIFSAVGAGCLLGPLLGNRVVAPRPAPLAWACAAAFGLLFLGYALMATARGIGMVLLSSLVRATGSACLWVYSSLLLQLRCPGALLGRAAAAELALYTVAEGASGLYGGLAFDALHLGARGAVAALAVVGAGVAAAWTRWAYRAARGANGGDDL